MSGADAFRAAWIDDSYPDASALDLLPVRLTRACVAVLPVAGAGLCIFSEDFRVPLGASDDDAAHAERLQFTIGEGPCLQALATNTAVRADVEIIARQWPILYPEWVEQTPFKAAVSVPLQFGDEARGALDLYLHEPGHVERVDTAVATEIAVEIGDVLSLNASRATNRGRPGPAWLHGETPGSRMQVWVAMGMLNVQLDLPAPDALALLRSYAYSHDLVLDDLAARLVARQMTPQELLLV